MDVIGNVVILVFMQTKSNFICFLLILNIKHGRTIDVSVLFENFQHILTIP